jgi:CheY-like chemotaxis protein
LEAKQKAEESDKLKTAFLQNMSHEIRTPMNAIMGFSDLLTHKVVDQSKVIYFSSIINQRCNDLLNIINDILDISKIESGQLPIDIEECNLIKVFEEIKSFFVEQQEVLNKQHIKFIINAQCPSDKTRIRTDKGKLKQVLINLINNAFKFTDDGMIEVGCSLDEANKLQFYVSDTGIGIPEDKHESIFERFVQLNQGNSRLYGGTGLGLSIVKGLITMLGGTIWLKSEPGAGSTFYFTMRYEDIDITTKKNEEELVVAEDANFTNKRILVVEDDDYNVEFINEILAGLGLIIYNASTGKEAVELALEHNPDLILLDIGLPDISGYEVIQKILNQTPGMKIIAQTAYASDSDKYRALQVGCIDYISKPMKPQQLLSLVGKHLV